MAQGNFESNLLYVVDIETGDPIPISNEVITSVKQDTVYFSRNEIPAGTSVEYALGFNATNGFITASKSCILKFNDTLNDGYILPAKIRFNFIDLSITKVIVEGISPSTLIDFWAQGKI